MGNNNLDQGFWLKYFKVYDTLNKLIPYRETLSSISSKIKGEDLKILDVGCGTGNLIKLIIEEKSVSRVVGVDYSEEALCIAKDKIDKDFAIFKKVDINKKLPFEDGYFDYVTMNNVLYTIKVSNRLNIIEEIYRVLKPGGGFISSNINDNFKPFNIYINHIKKSVSNIGVWKTLLDIVMFIKPTLLIFYYNYLIKKENQVGSYDFIKINEQGELFNKVGFIEIKDNIKTYSNSAYLTYGKK